MTNLLVVLICVFFIYLIGAVVHELGHARKQWKLGLPPTEIRLFCKNHGITFPWKPWGFKVKLGLNLMNKEVVERGIKRRIAELSVEDQLSYLRAGWLAMVIYFVIVLVVTYILARVISSWWTATIFAFVFVLVFLLIWISDRSSKEGDLNRASRIAGEEPLYTDEELEEDRKHEAEENPEGEK